MIDNELIMVSGEFLDLGKDFSSGNPIKYILYDIEGRQVIASSPDGISSTGNTTRTDVGFGNTVEAFLPNNMDRYIVATFSTGSIRIIMDSQTNT